MKTLQRVKPAGLARSARCHGSLTEAYATGRAWWSGQFCDAGEQLGSTSTLKPVAVARHKRLASASPNALEAGFPLSPHEEGALRRIAFSISKPKHLPARDVDYLIRLGLVEKIRDR